MTWQLLNKFFQLIQTNVTQISASNRWQEARHKYFFRLRALCFYQLIDRCTVDGLVKLQGHGYIEENQHHHFTEWANSSKHINLDRLSRSTVRPPLWPPCTWWPPTGGLQTQYAAWTNERLRLLAAWDKTGNVSLSSLSTSQRTSFVLGRSSPFFTLNKLCDTWAVAKPGLKAVIIGKNSTDVMCKATWKKVERPRQFRFRISFFFFFPFHCTLEMKTQNRWPLGGGKANISFLSFPLLSVKE